MIPEQDPVAPHRRRVLAALCMSFVATRALGRAPSAADTVAQVSALEREIGGRIGLAVLDTASGARIAHRADECFAMCSTFKLMLAASILSRVDSGALRLDQPLSYSRKDLLSTSPVTEANVQRGALSIGALAQAVVEVSDNTAANLLLTIIGGPAGFTSFLRALGDQHTRLDRFELALNSNQPGDPRDTTMPGAMLTDMNRTLVGNSLSTASRQRLLLWMQNCRTGRERLRARLPDGWIAGDKTGTGTRGATNDLAIFWPPQRPPILIACYMSDSEHSGDALNTAHARIGALVAQAIG